MKRSKKGYPGERTTRFLRQEVTKYHHTLTQILISLRHCGFLLDARADHVFFEGKLQREGHTVELRRISLGEITTSRCSSSLF